jgi:streptomycin 6-kinase
MILLPLLANVLLFLKIDRSLVPCIASSLGAFQEPCGDAAIYNNNNKTKLVQELVSLANLDYQEGPLVLQPLREKGFCNALYQVQNVGIAKLFSPLARARMQDSGFQDGEIDRLVGEKGFGPHILATSPNGILMEHLATSALTEADVHADDAHATIQAVAQALAAVHSIPIPEDCPHMLWHTMEVMLSMIPESSAKPYLERVNFHKQTLGSLKLPIVLGHGDFKPPNVMVVDGVAKVLDLEIAGNHFRAYDLAKFFRTEQKTRHTEHNQLDFLSMYLKACGDKMASSSPELLKAESDLLLPMSWLEAAIFFECSSTIDAAQRDMWIKLAKDRMQNYWKSMESHQASLRRYISFSEP